MTREQFETLLESDRSTAIQILAQARAESLDDADDVLNYVESINLGIVTPMIDMTDPDLANLGEFFDLFAEEEGD